MGTVFVGLAGPDGTTVQQLSLSGSREKIRADSSMEALRMIQECVRNGGEAKETE